MKIIEMLKTNNPMTSFSNDHPNIPNDFMFLIYGSRPYRMKIGQSTEKIYYLARSIMSNKEIKKTNQSCKRTT